MEFEAATSAEAACGIPIIDISPWTSSPVGSEPSSAQMRVAQSWDAAFREYGCAVVVGHGIAEAAFEQLNTEAREFFGLSLKVKQQYNHGKYGHPAGGYTAPGNEIVALSCAEDGAGGSASPKFDPVENFVFTSAPAQYASPSGSPAPIQSADAYYAAMNATLRTIHAISSTALGVDVDFFCQFYDAVEGSEKGANGNALRLAHYPAIDTIQAKASEQYDTQVRYGAHTDYQTYTILRPDKSDWHTGRVAGKSVRCGGLEVFHRSGSWVQVMIPQHLNALVVNAGDLFQRWTNDRWHSPLHRVVTQRMDTGADTGAEGKAEAEAGEVVSIPSLPRQSIVFFTGPLEDCTIEVLDLPGEPKQGPKYPPIRSGDHLLMKLNRTNDT
ncbi:hypothetical protein B484DRAFT_448980 [Ochromonadaceae sp. CCMP2298]|nr:hypothetical protein B484DRAFT_448980 [Ochromonadaceae sp. CCMP2298]|mmetsp:Transcript_22325/g.50540  ORF Transcript_22325/g.50540 Transcript_22325/m.50540 type:complete len:384 (+) Transcript_22325:76-1227(+)